MKGAAIFSVLIEGHHYVLHDELFQLLYLTIYNNTNVYPPNNSRISQKIFSNEHTAKLPSNFMVGQEIHSEVQDVLKLGRFSYFCLFWTLKLLIFSEPNM